MPRLSRDVRPPADEHGEQEVRTECWLCHKPQALPPPQYPHAEDAVLSVPPKMPPSRGQNGGALPMDHALRADTTCMLCHDIKTAANPPSAYPSVQPSAPASPNP